MSTAVKERNLGASGLRVSVVGLGCNNFGGRIDAEASRAVIAKALDSGITLFDIADTYGERGGSETLLGRFLGERRKEIVLASKFGNPMDDTGRLKGGSRRYLMSAVEASLKRLRTDWIDLYQLHSPDPLTPPDETMRAMDDLVRQGKVRYLGVSTHPAWQVVEKQWIARSHGLTPLSACEAQYSLIVREAERELIPALVRQGMGLLPYYPLACGFLSGKYRRDTPIPPGGRLSPGERYAQWYVNDANWDRLERLEAFCKANGRTLLELAFSWLAAQPAVGSVIAGATRPEQVEANVRAAGWMLSPEDLAHIDTICPPPVPIVP